MSVGARACLRAYIPTSETWTGRAKINTLASRDAQIHLDMKIIIFLASKMCHNFPEKCSIVDHINQGTTIKSHKSIEV